MGFLRRILARAMPSQRTVAQWASEYDTIISARPLSEKTTANRRANVRHIVQALGQRRLRTVRPVDIAVLSRAIWDSGRAFTARRVLIEACDMFNEAMLAGWIDTNPAISVRQLPARIRRRRLSLEQWQAIYDHASRGQHRAWLPHLLRLALVTGQRRADLQKMRFADIWDGHLHVVQQKTGARLAIPLALRLDALGITLLDVVDGCRAYAQAGDCLIRSQRGKPLGVSALTVGFEEARDAALGAWTEGETRPPSLHECRSLSERVYRAQGIDTRTLLGHRHQSMTDKYNDDRGLGQHDYKRLVL